MRHISIFAQFSSTTCFVQLVFSSESSYLLALLRLQHQPAFSHHHMLVVLILTKNCTGLSSIVMKGHVTQQYGPLMRFSVLVFFFIGFVDDKNSAVYKMLFYPLSHSSHKGWLMNSDSGWLRHVTDRLWQSENFSKFYKNSFILFHFNRTNLKTACWNCSTCSGFWLYIIQRVNWLSASYEMSGKDNCPFDKALWFRQQDVLFLLVTSG